MNTYEIEHLLEQQTLIEDITNNLELGICQFDVKEGKFLYLSPAMERLLGIPVAEVLRDRRMFVANCHAEDVEELIRVYKGAIKVQTDVEYRVLDTADEIRWLRTAVTPILDETDSALRYISITKDITDQKLKDELLQKWDKLNVVGQLSASLAHQIRNPLTTIKGFIQLLESDIDQSYTEIMTAELETIEDIVEEFLQLARPNSNGAELSKTSVHDKVNRTVTLMKKVAKVHNVTFQVMLSNEDAFIQCESKQIQQVLMNIIENAITAMPNGGCIEIRTAMKAGNMVKITITDTGIGMSLERLQKLGEPFYSEKEKGTGLGLMVCYKIIEFHNGTIQFTSKEGVGTTVEICLPIINPT